MKNIIKKTILSTLILGTTAIVTSCSAPNSRVVFPITTTPAELHEEFSISVDAVNSISLSNEIGSEVVENPNGILAGKNIDVYYDNTTGCFMGYVALREKNAQDIAYQMFMKTMTSMKDIFDSAHSYSTKTIQDGKEYLEWKVYPNNIFTNFSSEDAYTKKTTKPFFNDTSPVNMWVDSLKKQIESNDDSISVYISDLNEQNGLLAQSGKDLREILDANPDKEFLIITYDLSFKGDISSPTINNEGDKNSYVETKTFKDYVNRKYYILAMGGRDELTVLKNSITERFREVGIETKVFMYQDAHYTETVKSTLISDDTTIDSEFISQNPPTFSILDSDGNAISQDSGDSDNTTEAEEKSGDDMADLLMGGKKQDSQSSGTVLTNLEMNINESNFFTEKFSGDTYILKSLEPVMSGREAELKIRLDNTDLYTLDTEKAVIYTYDSISDKLPEPEEEVSHWTNDISVLPSKEITVDFEDDTVTVSLENYLSANRTNSTAAIIISVPVTFSYDNQTVVRELMKITPETQQMIDDCKVPDIITNANKDEQFTKTYNFDSFFDKITGYRAIMNLPDNIYEISCDKSSKTTTNTVDRLNIIIVADPASK